jgi:hypothetical protein
MTAPKTKFVRNFIASMTRVEKEASNSRFYGSPPKVAEKSADERGVQCSRNLQLKQVGFNDKKTIEKKMKKYYYFGPRKPTIIIRAIYKNLP